MQTSIHPPYYPRAKIRCVCGNEFTVGSTKESLEIEICSRCHPFYSGKKKVIDAAGRVERYRRMVAHAETKGNKAMKAKKSALKTVAFRHTEKLPRERQGVSVG